MSEFVSIIETGAKKGDRVIFHDSNGKKEPGTVQKCFGEARVIVMRFDSDRRHYQVSANKVEREHDSND